VARRLQRSPKPLRFSETVVPADEGFEPEELWEPAPSASQPGRPARISRRPAARQRPGLRVVSAPEPLPASTAGSVKVRALVAEWVMELKVMGRSQRTIDWYQQKMRWYLEHEGGPATLDGLTGSELKRLLASLQERNLAPNTVHGFFEVVRAFGNWADREGYPVDPSLLRMRPPKVPQTEMETYSDAQLGAIFEAAPAGWGRLAIQILLGTGMRISELAALVVEDVEDDGDEAFLKIRRGKGAKFRRVPISSRLRRELIRYINRTRPDTRAVQLLVLADGRPVSVMCVANLLRRIRYRVGFKVHAHRFRHTFATRYLRNGGEIERLRRILGHTSYVMVMRYLHLDKGDLGRDFELRAPF
jgi:integrase